MAGSTLHGSADAPPRQPHPDGAEPLDRHALTGRFRFDRIAWALCLVGLLLLGGAAVLGVSALNYLRHSIAHAELTRRLIDRDYAAAGADLANLLSPPRALQLAGAPLPELPEVKRKSERVHTILVALSEARFSEAIELFRDLLSRHGAALRARAGEEVVGHLDHDFTRLERESEALAAARSKREAEAVAESTRRTRHREVARELAALLGVKSRYEVDSAAPFDYYREGILQGLPLLAGLDQPVPDLAALAAAIEALGGDHDPADLGTNNEVSDRLVALRETSAALIRDEALTVAAAGASKSWLTKLEDEVTRIVGQLEAGLRALLVALTAPEKPGWLKKMSALLPGD